MQWFHKKPRGFDVLLVKMADNDHIKLDNIHLNLYVIQFYVVIVYHLDKQGV